MNKNQKELFKACEEKLEKMEARGLIGARRLSYSSMANEINAWIQRKDGHTTIIQDINSVEELIGRAKEFCQCARKKKEEVSALCEICKEKIRKMEAKGLIKNGDSQCNSMSHEVHAWIQRKDGHAMIIDNISSPDDFIERTKRFCKKKLNY